MQKGEKNQVLHKMAGDLFEDLPPLAAPPSSANGSANGSAVSPTEASPAPLPPLPPPPALKSALKRTKPPAESQSESRSIFLA